MSINGLPAIGLFLLALGTFTGPWLGKNTAGKVLI